MGGWIQYALSPTVSCWLAQHYDLQWRYSGDRRFLKQKAYPWFKDVLTYLEGITYLDSLGIRRLPLSSSPEFHDNSARAWFSGTTNYDLSLMLYAAIRGAKLAQELGKIQEANRWQQLANLLPNLAISENGSLAIADGAPYGQSHRHFSHLMAIHPLGLYTKENDAGIINQSLDELSRVGSGQWTGYSFAWQGNLYARAGEGEKAAEALRIFSEAFCLQPNGFHVNGDQSGKGYSTFRYRPFTLEGNFAFASGLQEMLIQSHAGFIEFLPAIPPTWSDLSFRQLRTEGGFLVDLIRKDHQLKELTITATTDRICRVKMHHKMPWKSLGDVRDAHWENGFFTAFMKKGSILHFKPTD
jgi:alpha-L-fucosidase 2